MDVHSYDFGRSRVKSCAVEQVRHHLAPTKVIWKQLTTYLQYLQVLDFPCLYKTLLGHIAVTRIALKFGSF